MDIKCICLFDGGFFLQYFECGSVAKWLGSWTCDQQVAGSNPGLAAVLLSATLGKLFTQMFPNTEQYNLVPANRR